MNPEELIYINSKIRRSCDLHNCRYTFDFFEAASKEVNPNILKGTKTYLVGSMEFENGERWRENATEVLVSMGVKVLNPYKCPFLFAPEENGDIQNELRKKLQSGSQESQESVHLHMKTIVRFDLACVDRSDFIIAYINPVVPTFGSMNEIVLARTLKKPLFLIVEGGIKCCPLWLLGMFPPHYIYNSLSEVLEILKKIDSEELKVDSDRWRLLKPEFR